jgi:hypothetical protein
MTSDAYNQQVERVCGLMQTPPHKIFHFGDSAKYSNAATLDLMYSNDCLIPTAKNFEEKLKMSLLDEDTEWDQFAFQFDRMPMQAGDPKILSDLLDKAIKSGAITVNEYREYLPLNLNPLPGDAGDVRYVPVNMAIVDLAGNVVQQAATGQNQGAGEGTTEDDEQPESERSIRLVASNA